MDRSARAGLLGNRQDVRPYLSETMSVKHRIMAIDDATDVHILSESECWTLLRSVDVGRLAVIADGHPDIFPINFVVDHGTLVFRTAEGTKSRAAVGEGALAFEVDGQDRGTRQAWSVVVKGTAEHVLGPELVDSVRLPLWPWQPDPKSRFLRIVPVEISGRSFGIADAGQWATPLSTARASASE